MDDGELTEVKQKVGLLDYLPWGIIGLLVVLGGATAISAGLPWETKSEALLKEQLMEQKISSAQAQSNTNAQQLGILTQQVIVQGNQISTLTQALQDEAKQREQQRLNKSNESLRRERYARRLDWQHHMNEIRAEERAFDTGIGN